MRIRKVFIILLTFFVLEACNMLQPDATPVAILSPTVPVMLPTQTATQTPVPPSPTVGPTATETPIPPTSTPLVPMVSVSMDTNCRTGPGKPYAYVGPLLKGEQAEVQGRNEDGDYWLVKIAKAPKPCWLWGQYATLSGNVDFIPVVAVPTLWQSDWKIYIQGLTGSSTGPEYFLVKMTQDEGVVSFSIPIEGDVLTFTGMLDEKNEKVSGVVMYKNGKTGPTFAWKILEGYKQFVGNWDGRAFCGARGAVKPDPCQWP